MIQADIRDSVVDVLRGIAPEVEPVDLVAGQPLRDQVDLDSMDFVGNGALPIDPAPAWP